MSGNVEWLVAPDQLPTSYQAILFDLDGTLLDTRELILASYHYACEQVLGYRLPDEPLLALIGVPLTEQMTRLVPEHAAEMIATYRQHNAAHHNEFIRYFPGTSELVAALAAQGWPLAVVTSKRRESALQGLDCFQLAGYFQLVIGSDETSQHKPHPDPLLLAAAMLGCQAPQCIYIGDSPFDMQAARAAGMLAIGAAWGMFTAAELRTAGAQILVPQTTELAAVLEQFQLKS